MEQRTCPYCDSPMTNIRRVQCGAADCKRQFNAERATERNRKLGMPVRMPGDTTTARRFRTRAERLAKRAAAGTGPGLVWVGHTMRPPETQNRQRFYSAPGPLRSAYESGDAKQLLAFLLARTTTTAAGCMVWPVLDRTGYPKVSIGRRTMAVHRLVAEAAHGPLGSQSAHHTCAHPPCINPAHLQPVSQRENIAEMLERIYYRKRISDLEAALLALAPNHPLLVTTAPVVAA